jgi:type II secretory pathway pseudopilin PulG
MSPSRGSQDLSDRPVRSTQSGFTIMETVVTAAIVAVVLSATIGVLFRYTETDVRNQKVIRALRLAHAEVDEILARHAVENSLVSDTQGRARYYPMERLKYPVSQYFFHNFPLNLDHASTAQVDPNNVDTIFLANQGRTSAGAPTTTAAGAFTLRYQLLGIDKNIQPEDLNRIIDLTANPTDGFYNRQCITPGTLVTVDGKTAANSWNPLIGDSSPSVGLDATRWSDRVRRYTTGYQGYADFVSKVFIVRVYDRLEPRRELGHAYGVMNGRVQL